MSAGISWNRAANRATNPRANDGMSPGRAQQRQVKHLCTKRSNGTHQERGAPTHSACWDRQRTGPRTPFRRRCGRRPVRPIVVNRAAEDCLVETHLGLRGTGIPSVPVGPRWGRADQRPAPAPIGLGVRVGGLRRLALPPRESRYGRGTPDGRYDGCRLRGATLRGMDNTLLALDSAHRAPA